LLFRRLRKASEGGIAVRPAPAVELDHLAKSFRVRRARASGLAARLHDFFAPDMQSVLAIDGLSFAIAPGERVAFIGPNGAGKSPTLKILAGVLHPDAGHVRVLGFVPSRQRRALGFEIGTVFGQRSQLWYQLPPRDTFELLGRVYEIDPREHRRRTDDLIALFGLDAIVGVPVRQLSLGQRMRCELAASLLHSPRLLFLDEPSIGLDVSAKAAIRSLLREQSERVGLTLLMTSHDTGDIERVCDRVIVINHGRLVWDGTLDELRRSYVTAKRVTIWSEAERLELTLAGVRVLASETYRTELEVDVRTASIGQVVDAALRHGGIRDLAVEDAPLDAVIQALYAAAETRGMPS
jgi:ABC-2 type transport system ATP-binding protein